MPASLRWMCILLIFALLAVVPFFHFRSVYAHSKRFREVEPGHLYRSGQLTAEGFADVVAENHIRLVLNVQEDFQDPDVCLSYLDRDTIKESALCEKLGVRYVCIPTDLVPDRNNPAAHPSGIDKFLELMDDPANHPVLLHCKAGLHRTGVFTAIYRMEYNGWTKQDALDEVRALGFGDLWCTPENDYIRQYVLKFTPGRRREAPARQTARTTEE
jgi:protein tyrosine phosphatase (PTP) superfamily phosphohydrolase (DUF442 family)